MKDLKNYLLGILIGLLLSSPAQAIVEDETIRCIFFGFSMEALRDRYTYQTWDEWLNEADQLTVKMMQKRRGWHK